MTKLDEYFDRARRETPPLQKDEVSNILREKLSERPDRETAHTRGNGVWRRGIGRVFLTLPLKGWIMISALLTSTILATAFFWQVTPQSAYNGASVSQTLPAAPQAAAPTGVSQKKIALKPQTEPNYAVKTQASKPESFTTTSAQTLKDSLPAPYDFVPIDDDPFIDIQALMQKVVYPEVAKKLGLEGKVNVRILVLPDGSVSSRSFVEYSDVHLFDSSALNSVYATRWEPAKRAGKAVPCWVSVPISYRLKERIGKNAVMKAQMLTLMAEELKKIGIKALDDGMLEVSGNSFTDVGFLTVRADIRERLRLKDELRNPAFSFNGDTVFKQIFQFLPEKSIAERKLSHAEYLLDYQTAKENGIQNVALPRLINDSKGVKYYFNLEGFKGDTKQRKEFFRQLVLQQSKTPEEALRDTAKLNQLGREARESEAKLKQFELEKSDISKLIGIRIPCTKALAEGDEYLLWYEPTPEFIALLPERYRTGLEREVAAAKKYATKCEIPTEEERKAIPGYFDSWRSCDGVLKIASIFPNPADVKATVRFTLAEARSVTITVHNLNGDRLAILEPTPMLPAGEHELPLDFTGRNVGVYLLALSTDKNETAIKRVIVSR